MACTSLRLIVFRWFACLWAGLVLVACAFDWRGPKSALFLAAAVLAAAIGYGVPRLRAMNVEVEADLLFEELETRLKGRRI